MKIVLDKFSGLNTSQAKILLPQGEFSGLQNIRQRPFENWVKRQGISFSTAQTSPVLGIFEIDLDNIVIPIVQRGDGLTFFPTLTTIDGSYSQPSPYPSTIPEIDPSRIVLFNVEQTMRAIQDRRVVAQHSAFTWPNLIFASDGTRLNGNTGVSVGTYPATNVYSPDLTFHDAFYGNPAGTRAAALVNSIITCCIETVGFNDYIDPDLVEGQSSLTTYTSSIFPSSSAANATNYRTQLSNCKTGIRRLTSIQMSATQVQVESKSGAASDSGVCTSPVVSSISISGYSDGFFDLSGCGSDLCEPCNGSNPCFSVGADCEAWNGSLTAGEFGPCVFTVVLSVGKNESTISGGVSTGYYDFSLFSVSYDDFSATWNFVIWAVTETSLVEVWNGSNSSSGPTDPRGVYTKGAGCDGHATITFV